MKKVDCLMYRLIRRLSFLCENSHECYKYLVKLLPYSRAYVKRKLEEKEIFFIVSTGRTGTVWMSQLLSKAVDDHVYHEPVPLETFAHRDAFLSSEIAEEYVRGFRIKDIYLRARSVKGHVYGEVNGILRRHVSALKGELPQAKFVHVIRDGRDFVRSVVSRGTYSGKHEVYGDFVPPPVYMSISEWANISEFEKSCWIWRWENEHLRKLVGRTVRFEDILANYQSFKQGILDPLGLTLDESVWERSIGEPKNQTESYQMEDWSGWSRENKQAFINICGEEMALHGYEV